MTDINTPENSEDPDVELEGDEDTPAEEMSSYNIAPPPEE